ncbi:NACHT, LRR and PYD domains-containing protein 3-like isoform X2 [Hydra vulgaris]|uniref:NACHT, LRR and PYD domains-containing protein 3-like isoform X2 n=1 Tax=Hydra vulgaris TaxID=6087 RepID=UPI001F5F6B3B|nr:NACHT, LRR and PYD domains-containing protein 3-like isoform X2 [Hydra vulgaris]
MEEGGGSCKDFKFTKQRFQYFFQKRFHVDGNIINKKIACCQELSPMSAELKKFYLEYYGKIDELEPLLKTSANVDLIQKFVDLCIVDSVTAQKNAVFSVEREEFLQKQMRYTPIPYSEIFTKEKSVLLISGIAGIGKTWLLRKCLLDWLNNLIWKNVKLVFYLECRRLNQYPNISDINELLIVFYKDIVNVFYKDIVNDFKLSSHTTMFIVDGLDEIQYFDELLNPNFTSYPIVNAFAEITKYKHVVDGLDEFNYFNELPNPRLTPIVKVLRDIKKYKHIIAGRVYAIDQYQSISTEQSNKLTIQIMGFNENGINNYIESHVMEEKKEVVKTTLAESPIAKAMASVPFYLSSMCKIISDVEIINKNSLLTMTDLYANIFLYFLRQHIFKNNKLIYKIMEDNTNKKYILNICKIAYNLFLQNKIIFSNEEFQDFLSDKNEGDFFGFIERIETDLGCYYQFAHLTIMEFCASVYASVYNCLSGDEIMTNTRLKTCLSMICGLAIKNQKSLIKFLFNLNPSKKSNKEPSLLCSILDRLSKSIKNYSADDFNFFYECFYESQPSFTDEIKSIVDEQNKRKLGGGWEISINDRKTSYATSCDNYFVNYYIKSGRKLMWLYVYKSILSDEEKNLLIRCSTNVCKVCFDRPINFEGWKPKDKIKKLWILISRYLITKKGFEENFLPWINLCEEYLDLQLHDDIDFIKDICEWIRCSNIKKFVIEYRGKKIYNLDELTL